MADKRSGKEGAMRLTTYDNICNSSVLAGTSEPPTLQVCRGSNLHKLKTVVQPVGQFRLICCTQL
jgi:hypothetical protein